VLEKIDDADRICRLPRILEGNFRRGVLQSRLKIDAALFFEFEKRERNKSLADGADAEFGVASDVSILREVGLADAAAPEDGAVGDEGDASAGDVF
jgi:hypothetical protein